MAPPSKALWALSILSGLSGYNPLPLISTRRPGVGVSTRLVKVCKSRWGFVKAVGMGFEVTVVTRLQEMGWKSAAIGHPLKIGPSGPGLKRQIIAFLFAALKRRSSKAIDAVYSTLSAIQRETAVTILRGAKRVDSATIQLRAPLMTRPRPSMTAR